MKLIKITIINLSIFLISFLVIEILFGYWFSKDNFGAYMREHRLKKVNYNLTYNNKQHDYNYERNFYGFRGSHVEPKDISAMIIGGSTTDERYKPENYTITGYLNLKLKTYGNKLTITNAGIEGQSTRGHIVNFEKWFPKLKNFKPKIVIFYIGINDTLANMNIKERDIFTDGHILNPDKKEVFYDNLKSSSIFYNLLRKTKHKYYNKKTSLIYDFDLGSKNYISEDEYKFLNYESALSKYNIKNLKKINKDRINYFLNNVDKLYLESKALGSDPIFINQVISKGAYDKTLFTINLSLIEHCKKMNYNCIDLQKKLKGQRDYWWDGIHTTPKGSQKIAELIFPDLLSFFEK